MNLPAWILWLAGTLLPLGALWGLWQWLLRREQCFGYNRALLLLAPLVAAAWPLLPYPALPEWLNSGAVAAAPVAVLLPTMSAVAIGQAAASGWQMGSWLLVLYVVGVALGLGRLLWQVVQLHRLSRALPRVEYPDYTLVRTGGRLPTSAFGRVVFWDETTALGPAEATAVLAHEVAHVRQHHTWDVLWLEVWRVVLWPNPFAHLLLPALRLTHELLADRAAAASTLATPYTSLLAQLAARRLTGPAYSSLLQPFTLSFTLTRITMLKNPNPVRRWKQWLVLPMLGGLFLAAGYSASAQTGRAKVDRVPSEAEQQARIAIIRRKVREAEKADSLRTGGKHEPGTTQQFNITNMNGPGEPVVTITWVKKDAMMPNSTNSAEQRSDVYTYVEQMPQLPGGGGMAAIMAAIQRNFVYPAGNTSAGMVFAKFIVNADGTVSDPTILKGLTDAADQAVLESIQKLPRFEPGKQDGRAVAVSFTVPVKLVPQR